MDGEFAARAAQDVELIIRIREARSEALGPDLFSDPAWDILLALCAARLRNRRLTLADIATNVPCSTLARWAYVLEERGLICCDADTIVPSVLRLSLSPLGELRMSSLVSKLRQLHPAE